MRTRDIAKVAAAMLFAACTNENMGPFNNSGKICIADPTIGSPAEVRGAGVQVNELPGIHNDSVDISITEYVRPMGVETRANGIMDLDMLRSQGFTVQGYLHGVSGTEQDPHFMQDVKASYGTAWTLSPETKWREDWSHIFWAYAGSPVNFVASPETGSSQFTTATFSYNNPGDEDLILARTHQAYDGTNPTIEFSFSHALAALDAMPGGVDQFVYRMDDSTHTTIIDCQNRMKILNIQLDTKTSGTCTATGSGFTWTPGSSVGYASLFDNVSKTGFVIPQSQGDHNLKITFFDNYKLTTCDVTLPTTSFGTGNWQAGHKYSYSLKGTLKFDYAPDVVVIDPSDPSQNPVPFTGNAKSECLVTDFDTQFIKKVTLSWVGAPNTNSSVLTACLVQNTSAADPVTNPGSSGTSEYFTKSALVVQPNMGWGVSITSKSGFQVVVGQCEYNATDPALSPCSCTFDIEALEQAGILDPDEHNVKFWLIYVGGNASSNPNWKLNSVKVSIDEYR